MTVFGGAGGRGNEGRMPVDGLNIGATVNGGGVSTYIADIGNAAGSGDHASGGLGEAEVGGPAHEHRPEDRRQHGQGRRSICPAYRKGWVDSNYSDELKDAGLTTPGALIKQWDFNVGVGGPIKKDRLWYFVTARDEGQYRSIPGIYPEPERRRSDQVPLRARHEPPSAGRRELAGRDHPAHGAGDSAAQIQLLLGRATAVQRRAYSSTDVDGCRNSRNRARPSARSDSAA